MTPEERFEEELRTLVNKYKDMMVADDSLVLVMDTVAEELEAT